MALYLQIVALLTFISTVISEQIQFEQFKVLQAAQKVTILTTDQHGLVLYICWVPGAFIAILIIRNFKHYGFVTAVAHSFIGLIIVALTFFSLIDRLNQGFSFSLVKRRAGLSALAFVGLLLISGIAMAILKSAKRPVSPTVLNFFRLFHALCGIGTMLACLFAMRIGLEFSQVVTERTKQLWAASYAIFMAITVILQSGRVCKCCSKRDFNTAERQYSIQTLNYEIASGRKLVIMDNRVIELPPLFHLFHPGGRFLIEKSIGQDIGRFLNGVYKQPGQQNQHSHSPYAVNRLKARVVGILGDNVNFFEAFFSNDFQSVTAQWLSQIWRVSSRTRITSLVKRISFQKVGLSRRLMISNPQCWGKHFRYTSLTPWGRVTRYYTFCFALGERMVKHQDDLIECWQTYGNYEPDLDIQTARTQTIDAFPKLYCFPKAFSNYIYSIDQYDSKLNRFFLEGPMVSGWMMSQGLGLRLEPGAEGTYIALTAGTGIVPFMDLILYMLRRGLFRAGRDENRILQIFNNEFQQLAVSDDFRLIVWASFSEEDEVIGLKYMRILERLSKEYDFNNFNLVLRLSGSNRWNLDYLRKHIDLSAQQIWIRGPQDFNQEMKIYLHALGYDPALIVET